MIEESTSGIGKIVSNDSVHFSEVHLLADEVDDYASYHVPKGWSKPAYEVAPCWDDFIDDGATECMCIG